MIGPYPNVGLAPHRPRAMCHMIMLDFANNINSALHPWVFRRLTLCEQCGTLLKRVGEKPGFYPPPGQPCTNVTLTHDTAQTPDHWRRGVVA